MCVARNRRAKKQKVRLRVRRSKAKNPACLSTLYTLASSAATSGEPNCRRGNLHRWYYIHHITGGLSCSEQSALVEVHTVMYIVSYFRRRLCPLRIIQTEYVCFARSIGYLPMSCRSAVAQECINLEVKSRRASHDRPVYSVCTVGALYVSQSSYVKMLGKYPEHCR